MLYFGKLLVANKVMDERVRGGIKIFRRQFFVPKCRNFSQGNPIVMCLRKTPAVKRLWI